MTPIRRLDSTQAGFDARLSELLAFEATQDASVERAVTEILSDVRTRGDAALLDCTRRFDGVEAGSVAELEIPAGELRAALGRLAGSAREALEAAAQRVRIYHEKQLGSSWSYRDPNGTELGQRVTPLDRVGMYVPGGKAA